MAGKRRRSQRQLNVIVAGGKLLFVTDSFTGTQFLVDTGAVVSVLPFRSAAPPSGPRLVGPDNRLIPSWGTVNRSLRLGGRVYAGKFVRAAVSKPILGADFLASHRLLVDPAKLQLLDPAARPAVALAPASRQVDACLASG